MEKARSEGFNRGKAQAQRPKTLNMGDIIAEIGDTRGIGQAKLNDIREILKKHLEVTEEC